MLYFVYLIKTNVFFLYFVLFMVLRCAVQQVYELFDGVNLIMINIKLKSFFVFYRKHKLYKNELFIRRRKQ